MKRLLSSYDFEHQCSLISSVKRRFLIAHLIQNTTKSPNVTFFIIWLFFTHFGTKIVGSAHHCVCKVDFFMHRLCNSQISDSKLKVYLTFSSLVKNTFMVLMSRCRIFLEWMYSRPMVSWMKNFQILCSAMGRWNWHLIYWLKSPPLQYSIMMFK